MLLYMIQNFTDILKSKRAFLHQNYDLTDYNSITFGDYI